MLQAPNPFLKPLEDHILLGSVTGKRRHCQIMFRIVSPNSRKRANLHIRHSQIEAKLQLIVDGIGIVSPISGFVIGAAFALQNAGSIVLLTGKAAVKVRKSPRVICVLIHIGIVIDRIAGFLLIPIGRDRFQKMTHHQLLLIGFHRRLHPSLFDHP